MGAENSISNNINNNTFPANWGPAPKGEEEDFKKKINIFGQETSCGAHMAAMLPNGQKNSVWT